MHNRVAAQGRDHYNASPIRILKVGPPRARTARRADHTDAQRSQDSCWLARLFSLRGTTTGQVRVPAWSASLLRRRQLRFAHEQHVQCKDATAQNIHRCPSHCFPEEAAPWQPYTPTCCAATTGGLSREAAFNTRRLVYASTTGHRHDASSVGNMFGCSENPYGIRGSLKHRMPSGIRCVSI